MGELVRWPVHEDRKDFFEITVAFVLNLLIPLALMCFFVFSAWPSPQSAARSPQVQGGSPKPQAGLPAPRAGTMEYRAGG